MLPTVATVLPLEAVVQLIPGAVAQPDSLQQHAVCLGLLLGGVQQLVGSGSSLPGSLFFPPLNLLVDLMGLLGAGASDPLLHLAPAERDVSWYLGPLHGSPGGCLWPRCPGHPSVQPKTQQVNTILEIEGS